MKRRDFLKGVVQGTVAVSASALSASRVFGANQRVRIGWIGCGGRGRFVSGHMREVPDAEIVAVCDVYEKNRLAAQQSVGESCKAYADFRELLDQKDIDAVLVATPDHWHAIPTVLSCEAGKDVYVEKPLAHNIREGRAMVDAARRYDRVVQTGIQQRSAAHFAQIREIIQSGELGKVHYVRIWNYRNSYPLGVGRPSDAEVPTGLDWDFYLGPAPSVPYDRRRFLSSFRWFFDYAGGYITDWGTHRFDSMRQVMGEQMPRTVSAAGGQFALEHGGDMPDIHQVTYEFPGFVVSYEACNLNAHGMGGRTPGRKYYRMAGTDDRPNGLAFYGTNGALFADRIGFEIYPEPVPRRRRGEAMSRDAAKFRMERKVAFTPDSTALHVQNFIECVKSRQRPVADVEIGHRSSIVPHLGNIAYKTGRKLKWDAAKEIVTDDAEATKLLAREARQPWDLI